MSMVFCRGCGKEIHESAVTCPSCGAVQNLKKERNTIGLVFIALGWAILLWFVALFISGFVIGIFNPEDAEQLGTDFGEAAAIPFLFIALILSGVLTKLGKLPGTSKIL